MFRELNLTLFRPGEGRRGPALNLTLYTSINISVKATKLGYLKGKFFKLKVFLQVFYSHFEEVLALIIDFD